MKQTNTPRRVLITGASQGIGRACAEAFASNGDQVLLVARRHEVLAKLVRELPGEGHEFFAVDLANLAQVKKLAAELVGKGIEVFVNSGGGPPAGALLQASIDDWEHAFHSLLLAPQILLQALVPEMQQHQRGRLINIISTSVKVPIPGLGVSNTLRGAVANWAKTLAGELGPMGITVNNVLPGYTVTPRFEQLRQSLANKKQVAPEQIEKEWLATIPIGRFTQSSETARVVSFLADPASGSINGMNFPVDGGRTPSL